MSEIFTDEKLANSFISSIVSSFFCSSLFYLQTGELISAGAYLMVTFACLVPFYWYIWSFVPYLVDRWVSNFFIKLLIHSVVGVVMGAVVSAAANNISLSGICLTTGLIASVIYYLLFSVKLLKVRE